MPPEIKRKTEKAATVYLEMRGFKIIEKNWSRAKSKIHIIAQKDQLMHFIEIKYQDSSSSQSIETITESKLKQMHLASYVWLGESKWSGEYMFSTIELTGPSFTVVAFNENVT